MDVNRALKGAEAYILNIADRSLVYKELVYKVIRSECMLCGSTTMSSLGSGIYLPKMGWNSRT